MIHKFRRIKYIDSRKYAFKGVPFQEAFLNNKQNTSEKNGFQSNYERKDYT